MGYLRRRLLRIKTWTVCAALGAAATFTNPPAALADEPSFTRGLCRYPDVSKDSIVFIYANDIWLVPKAGGTARPVANPPGFEGAPRFSPDGKSIAFRANYDQGLDLYTLSIDGGIPQRVTHHPAVESLCGWTPDGKGLLFMASGIDGLPVATKLYSVPASGGLPVKLPVPYGANGTLDKTGEWLAYTPHSTDTRTWKRYRGGMATDVWLVHLKTGESRRITQWEGTDTLPMWHGRKVYYLSDEGAAEAHVLNIWSYDVDSGERRQVTRFKEHDIKWPSIGPDDEGSGEIVFQHGDRIYLLDLKTNETRAIDIQVPGDRESLRATIVDASQSLQGGSISPSGKRVAIVARGDIWSAPAESGTPRNLTRTDGVYERSAAWSPDGKSIAFFSDASGEYELYTMPADSKPADSKTADSKPADGKPAAEGTAISGTPSLAPKQITWPVDGVPSVFRTAIEWSPDSKSIVIQDKAGNIDMVKLEDGSIIRLDRNPEAPNPVRISFSQDSRWIAWSRSCDTSELYAIYLYDTKEADPTKARTQVTSGFYSDHTATFDRKGDWLVYMSSRNFVPTESDFDSTWIYNKSEVLMAVPLKKDFKLPWLPTSDEEGQNDDAGKKDEKKDEKKGDASAGTGAAGTWNCKATVGIAPIAITLVLTENAGGVNGAITSVMGNFDLSGTFDATTGALKLNGTAQGRTFELDLKIEGDSLSGTANVDTGQGQAMKIDFSGTRAVEKKQDNDGEKKDGKQEGQADGEKDEKKGEKKDEKKDSKKEVVIDLDGFEARAIQLPAAAGSFGSLGFNDRNELLYGRDGSVRIMNLSSKSPTESTGASGERFEVSADGKKLLMGVRIGTSIANASAGGGAKPIVTSPMLVEIHPRHERAQILADVYRIFRDYFYDEGMHGVDWNGIRAKYEAMLPAVVTREDLNYLISEMISELNVGHAYLQSAGDVEAAPSRSVGMLGVEFAPATNDDGTLANAWKIARIVTSASFDSETRSPLAAQGLDVSEGDYLLAVNGEPVDPARDPWSQFLGLSGKAVVLTVSKKPVMDNEAKDVVVSTLPSESELHYRAWVESKRRRVEELSKGKIGYIYVPNTRGDGQSELVRQFFGQRTKPALLIDERWNGGGQLPTRFIELLNRPLTNFWARRDARAERTPADGHHGPKAMLVNGLAGSGGDMFPWLFKHGKLGPVIGTRTWGGLVGITGNPDLIDGGSISVPTFGFYEIDGTWGVEGHGVDPDIEVIDDPAKMKDGGDPQLEKAVEVLLKELETNPYKPVGKPKGPDRRSMGLPESDR